MIDGLTFGVAAGAAFAAAETIVVNRGLFCSFGQVDSPNAGFWVSLILSAAVVKPIVYGAATGIAVASFSGLGAGYDGFKPAYFRGLAEALAANILFQGGLFFAARLEGTKGAVVGLVWGALIAAALVVRLRYLLHFAVLEAALEAASTGTELKDAARGTAYCPSCEMPLMAGANFCVACGTSVRAGSKVTRARNRHARTPIPRPRSRASSRPRPGSRRRTTRRPRWWSAPWPRPSCSAGWSARPRPPRPPTRTSRRPARPIDLETQVGSGPDDRPGSGPGAGARPDARRVRGRVVRRRRRRWPRRSAGVVRRPRRRPTRRRHEPRPTPDDGGGGIGTTTADGSTVDRRRRHQLPDAGRLRGRAAGGRLRQVFGDGGYFFAIINPAPTDLNAMITEHLNGLQSMGIQDLAVSEPEASRRSRARRSCSAWCSASRACWPPSRAARVPLEGFAYYFVLQDGTRRHGVQPLRAGRAGPRTAR